MKDILMKRFTILAIFSIWAASAFAIVDTVKVPFQRIYFHDLIAKQQVYCDKADGKLDGSVKVSGSDEINLEVTDVINRQINALADSVETNTKIPTNQQKIKYLRYIENVLMIHHYNLLHLE